MEEVPEEVEKIKKLFYLVIAGKILGAVARYFNERDITFRGYYSTVAILSNYIHSDIYRRIRRRTIQSLQAKKAREVKLGKSLSEMTNLLNQQGFVTSKGCKFQIVQVKRLLIKDGLTI